MNVLAEQDLEELLQPRFDEDGERIWYTDSEIRQAIQQARLLTKTPPAVKPYPYPVYRKRTTDSCYAIPQYPHERLKP